MRRAWAETLVWLVPGLAALVLYRGCLGFTWSSDEVIFLKTAILHTPLQYLFAPPVYRELSQGLFFPGALLSFDLESVAASASR